MVQWLKKVENNLWPTGLPTSQVYTIYFLLKLI